MNLKIKKINSGVNSNSIFFNTIKKHFFFSIINIKNIKVIVLKILQNKLSHCVSKIIICFDKIVLYKKNIGNNILFPNLNNTIKLCKYINYNFKNVYVTKKQFKFIIYKLKIKNLISKKIFKFIIKKKKYTKKLSHNDLFKDNIIYYGNHLISIIDYNNYIYCSNIIDKIIVKHELCWNYNIIKSSLLENLKKKSLSTKLFYLNLVISRFIKIINYKKTKNYYSYLKKNDYNKF